MTVMEVIDRDVSCVEPTITDARPRKRRRITNTSFATQLDLNLNHPSQRSCFSVTPQRPNSFYLLELGVETGSQETCQTCRRCKSNYYCSRCTTPTCSICTRTCTIAAMSTPPTPVLCFSPTPSPKPGTARLSMDDSSDSIEAIDAGDLRIRLSQSSALPTASKRRSSSSEDKSSGRNIYNETDDTSWWEESSSGGCGRTVCQACAIEDADSHESTCLDCLNGSGFSLSVSRAFHDV
ncbi:hypothetical protein OPQ81_006779 [Rhizoctonia solani]|nr:hypothetical protein OPQ81_006779 [Rhizoctonia solani]